MANWLSQRAGLSGSEAKQLCRVARRLPDLPRIDAAFRAGRLSLDTTDVLVKVATRANESVVLETAGAATGAQLRKIIATFRRIRAHDEPDFRVSLFPSGRGPLDDTQIAGFDPMMRLPVP